MTKPLKPTNNVYIGGVKFNSNDIAKKQTLINDRGAVRYSVFLKNGLHVEYPKQNPKNNASVSGGHDTSKHETWTWVNNLAYGQVKGTKKSDVIILNGNNNTTVDVTGDNNKLGDQVMIADTLKDHYGGDAIPQKKFVPSQNNKVITDKDDHIDIETKNTKISVEGEGITTEASLKGIKQE